MANSIRLLKQPVSHEACPLEHLERVALQRLLYWSAPRYLRSDDAASVGGKESSSLGMVFALDRRLLLKQ